MLAVRSRVLMKVLAFALACCGTILLSFHLASGQNAPTAQAPSYCNPCLFYAGDFDPNNPASGGLLNQNVTAQPTLAYLEVPFVVPEGQAWLVTGVFVNQLASVDFVDPAITPWVIYRKIREQEVVCSGSTNATFRPTGRSGFGLDEYTLLVEPVACSITSGTYWLQVVPQCTNKNDNECPSATYFESDVEDQPPLNSYGPLEPWDTSVDCTEICQQVGNQGAGNDRFSTGLVGLKLAVGRPKSAH